MRPVSLYLWLLGGIVLELARETRPARDAASVTVHTVAP